MKRKRVPGDTDRKIGKINQKTKNWDEEKSLKKAVFRGVLRKITNASDKTKPQRKGKYGKSDENRKKVKRVTGARIGHGFLVAVVGKRVPFCFVRRGSRRRFSRRFDLLRRRSANRGSFLNREGGRKNAGRQPQTNDEQQRMGSALARHSSPSVPIDESPRGTTKRRGRLSMQYIWLHLQPSTSPRAPCRGEALKVRWPRDKEGKHEIETINVQ